MITLYEGVPGSGKSLFSAGQILDQLSLGHLVICNFPFSVPSKKKYRRGALVTCSNDELSVAFILKQRKGVVSGRPAPPNPEKMST